MVIYVFSASQRRDQNIFNLLEYCALNTILNTIHGFFLNVLAVLYSEGNCIKCS